MQWVNVKPAPPPPQYPHRGQRDGYAYYKYPYAAKIDAAMMRVVEQIPMRLAHRIAEIRFGPEGVTDPRFEVVYMGGKVIEFPEIDTFPTEADIARIALECP